MWRSLVQSKCEHGSWNSEFGIWDGVPSDPWWFKPEIDEVAFQEEALKAGFHFHSTCGMTQELPEELDQIDDSSWFVIESQYLLSYQFTDPTNQLRRMAAELFSYATHHKLCLKNLRVVMYQSPIKTA